jgi:CHAT domain-containing protein
LLKTEDEEQRSALLDKILQLERNLAYEENESDYGQDEKEIRAASLTNLRAALRADEQLVEYVLLSSHSYCIVVTRESANIIMLPEGRESIKNLIDSYTKELKSKQQGTDLASTLYSVLLAPVLRPQKPRLIVSPQGELKNLPFESLIGPSGQYLVQREVVTYIPSATTLWLQRTTTSPAAPKYSLLAVGDVDYRADRQHGLMSAIRRGIESLSQSKIVDLPETRDEVLTVAQAVGGDAKLLLGQDATESAFKTQPLGNFRIIHLAVHALADSQYPERTALLLGIDPAASDDGLLQVREILHLHLNSELVTLSACETGVAGQAGVFSLQESFLIGGAHTVVASLWNVEDQSTTVLMQRFYRHLAEGEDKGKALTHAKQDFVSQFPSVSPFYWAGFVMAGEGHMAISRFH